MSSARLKTTLILQLTQISDKDYKLNDTHNEKNQNNWSTQDQK